MKTQEYKKHLAKKLNDIQASRVAPEDIAIERNAEIMDEIQRTSDREIALTTLALSWKTSVAVQAALDRIAAGTYGICLGCDEPISERRLNAIPWAEQCIACQQRDEIKPELAIAA